MKLSKNNKLYAAVLGLGVLALGVDKLFLGGGPSEASAQTPESALKPAATAGPTAAKAATGPTLSVAAQLDVLAEARALPPVEPDGDAFGVPTALAEAIDAEVSRAKAEEQRLAQEKQAAELLANLRLTAVRIPREGTPQALINGNLLYLGDNVSGTAFRVIEITSDHVVLQGADEGPRVTLELRPELGK